MGFGGGEGKYFCILKEEILQKLINHNHKEFGNGTHQLKQQIPHCMAGGSHYKRISHPFVASHHLGRVEVSPPPRGGACESPENDLPPTCRHGFVYVELT